MAATAAAPAGGGEVLAALRRAPWWGVLALVLLAHWQLAERLPDWLGDDRLGSGAADRVPPRIDVAFVRALTAAPPPAVPPRVGVAAPAHLPAVAKRPAAAASRPSADDSTLPDRATDTAVAATVDGPAVRSPVGDTTDGPPATPAPVGPDAAATSAGADAPARGPGAASAAGVPELPAATAVVEAGPAGAAAPASAPPVAEAQAFAWPPSTRLSYRLAGHYRGPVEGTAQVEWLREGSRYQVRMATRIGPVLSRSVVSEGELTERGLRPQRFTGEQKVLFRDARRWSLRFEGAQFVNTEGRSLPAEPGVQDEASQFVQLTWLFTTRPERLRVGESVDIPLVINRKLDHWIYDVVGEETLHFSFGPVATLHVKPRREADAGDMSAEIWFAPTLQYLPVRILIHQGRDSWADLTLLQAPEQAAR